MNEYYNSVFDDNTSIAHYGILGQKWGVRRYQNEDGTLTPAGKARIYGAGAEGGLESFKSRSNRARDAAFQREVADKYTSKAEKASWKGKHEKEAKYRDKAMKARTNEKIYNKGLSQEEIEYGERRRIANKAANTAMSVGWLIGGLPGGVTSAAITSLVNYGINTSARKAAENAYAQYRTTKLSEINSM